MFTLKFYSHSGDKVRIVSADSLSILRDGSGAEITLHQRNSVDDYRMDVDAKKRPAEWPAAYDKVIIENAAGKTTEIIEASPA